MIDEYALAREVRRTLGLKREPDLHFLARGEYSINYVCLEAPEPYVVRCVTGSQIGLQLDAQVRYEDRVLHLLTASGHTPHPIAVQPHPREVAHPLLIEGYLDGRPLNYQTDLDEAALCLADIHRLPVPDDHGLQVHAQPGASILAESRTWATDYLAWPDAPRDSQHALRAAFSVVESDSRLVNNDVSAADLAIVNYDVNTHNFIVNADGRVSLIDWEKGRVAPAVQDLAHFLLPTTTLWRSDTSTRLTLAQESQFVDRYLAARPELDPQRVRDDLTWMQRLIALRAVSWCSWAVAAAATGTRSAPDDETLARSQMYLEPAFLYSLFGLDSRPHGASRRRS